MFRGRPAECWSVGLFFGCYVAVGRGGISRKNSLFFSIAYMMLRWCCARQMIAALWRLPSVRLRW